MTKFIMILLFSTINIQAELQNFNEIFEKTIPPVPYSNLKEWTVAIYINGKNNVDMFAFTDFNRIETVGSSDKINIVIEIGRAQGFMEGEATPEVWSGVRRYYIIKDTDTTKINSKLIEDRKNADMGDWKEVSDFLKWAKINYPAKKYMFIIWNHGWGWIDPVKENSNLADSKSISHDFITNNYIKTTELKNIFKYAGKVNVYASMACFMQMAEVISEIKDYADVIVGSEEVIQLPSFNWEDFFDSLVKNPTLNSDKVGILLVDTFKEMYQRPQYFQLLVDGQYGTQLSAIKTKHMNEFIESIKRFVEIIPKLKDIEAISKAKKDVLRFEVGEVYNDPDKLISFYADIYHFLELIEKNYKLKDDSYFLLFTSEFKNFKNIVDKKLVIKNVYLYKDRTQKDFSNTHGISMHIPGKEGHLIDYYETYEELEFEKLTKWSKVIEFLKKID
ncbi:MAG: clostripain-related cysteine peptidase [Elusimicrobiales bacterium]|nr:clostripain-related cysteine peptidase [Elusimicrobiales bacterium]